MQRSPHRCPRCSQPLDISWDMWGQFYVCQECGFTAEDDDDLTVVPEKRPFPALPLWAIPPKHSWPWHAALRR